MILYGIIYLVVIVLIVDKFDKVMKNKKGNVAMIVIIVVIVAISASVIGWMFAKKAQAPAEQAVAIQSAPITNTNPSKLDCPQDDPYNYCVTRPDGSTVLLKLDPNSVHTIKPNYSFYDAGLNSTNLGSIAKSCLPQEYLDTIDLHTFELVGRCFAKDKNNVYWASACGQDCMFYKKITKVNPGSFQMINDSNFAKDSQHLYFIYSKNSSPIILGADLKSFEVLSAYFAKDNKHVFFGDYVLNADLSSIKVDESGKAKDKNNSYNCSYGNVVCGTNCIITDLKTGKTRTDYFGIKPTESACNQ